LEIQTDSSTAIQSGFPGTSNTAAGFKLPIGMRTPGVLTPGRPPCAQSKSTINNK
jgi:hypothetical protein